MLLYCTVRPSLMIVLHVVLEHQPRSVPFHSGSSGVFLSRNLCMRQTMESFFVCVCVVFHCYRYLFSMFRCPSNKTKLDKY
jgi:hypothetical protein